MLNQLYQALSQGTDFSFEQCIASLHHKTLILYGAGGVGKLTSDILLEHGCQIRCFVDDAPDKQHSFVNGIEVVNLETIPPTTQDTIVICIPNFTNVQRKLRELGYQNILSLPLLMIKDGFYSHALLRKHRSSIVTVYDLLADKASKLVFTRLIKHRLTMDFSLIQDIVSPKQYFPDDLITFHDRECFVDGGAYQGETIRDFIQAVNDKFLYIYGFEPDKHNFKQLQSSIRTIAPEQIGIWNAGLHSQAGEASFSSHGNSSSSISHTGNETISLLALDDLIAQHTKLTNQPDLMNHQSTTVNPHIPTYIKLDIEGAEAAALHGMRRTIINDRPRIAVSVYHKPTDLWELPLLLHRLMPEYKLYMRHYMEDLHETVCYGIC